MKFRRKCSNCVKLETRMKIIANHADIVMIGKTTLNVNEISDLLTALQCIYNEAKK